MSDEAVTPKTIEQLKLVRNGLLQLHKILLDYQRHVWERTGGPISNSYQLLNLVLHDPYFAWLHQLSELVVQIDELLDADEATEEYAVGLLDQARFLLVPSETGDQFQKNYFEALQQSPDVVLAHSEVVKLMGKKNSNVH